jgi:oligopeptide transport system ATP-binding protein
MAQNKALLEVKDLSVRFSRRDGAPVDAVQRVSFSLDKGKTLGIVGESGSGKSQTVMALLGLLAKNGKVSGEALYNGANLLTMNDAALNRIRGDRIGMIFQDPMTSLNPFLTIERQMTETLQLHRKLSRREAKQRAIETLERVRIPDAARRIGMYPHEFSGGMRQRVMIAIALACSPKVLIADEPTTALDVTIQAQVLALLADLQRREGLAVLLITHNLGVVAAVADRVIVMYGGDVVESAPVKEFFGRPTHPYSEALLAAMPRVDRSADSLAPIPGQVPTLAELPPGCRFQSRCPLRIAKCAELPPLIPLAGAPSHGVRCWVRAP